LKNNCSASDWLTSCFLTFFRELPESQSKPTISLKLIIHVYYHHIPDLQMRQCIRIADLPRVLTAKEARRRGVQSRESVSQRGLPKAGASDTGLNSGPPWDHPPAFWCPLMPGSFFNSLIYKALAGMARRKIAWLRVRQIRLRGEFRRRSIAEAPAGSEQP